jgi:hypothetical protein
VAVERHSPLPPNRPYLNLSHALVFPRGRFISCDRVGAFRWDRGHTFFTLTSPGVVV